MRTVTVMITNTYADGHRSRRTLSLPAPDESNAPAGDLDAWWQDIVAPETGDGHGNGRDLGYCYTAEVINAPEQHRHLVGRSEEWIG